VPFNVFVLAFLGVIVAGIINIIYIKKNIYFPYIVLNKESVRLNNFKIPRGNIVGINIIYKKKGSSLVRSKRIGLFTYKY